MTRVKWGKFSELECFSAKIPLWVGRTMKSVSEGSHFIFVCSGWCKGMTERRKLRSREPSRICARLTIALQKNRQIRCLLKEYWGLFQGHLYLTSSDKVVFGKSMSVLSISLGYQLKRRERRKSVVLKNRCKIFRDNNHQSLYKKIKLFF